MSKQTVRISPCSVIIDDGWITPGMLEIQRLMMADKQKGKPSICIAQVFLTGEFNSMTLAYVDHAKAVKFIKYMQRIGIAKKKP